MRLVVRIAGVLFLLAVFLTMGPRVMEQLRAREKTEAAARLGESVKGRIDRFYAEQKRLPGSSEADKFRADGDSHTKSVVYDADKKMIVITMSGTERQFAMHAEEKGGAISWTCRTIDIYRGDLPPACR